MLKRMEGATFIPALEKEEVKIYIFFKTKRISLVLIEKIMELATFDLNKYLKIMYVLPF